MKLFFDENVGYRVPEAMRLVGVEDVHYLTEMFGVEGRPAQGVKDQDWIPVIGDSYLALSRDARLLRRPHQKLLLAEHRVGIILHHCCLRLSDRNACFQGSADSIV